MQKSQQHNTLMPKIDNSIILMGSDNYDFKSTYTKFLKDGEIYLDFFNKYDLELFGKKLGTIYFEEHDKSNLLPKKIIVVGNNQVAGSFVDYLPSQKERKKDYEFIHQGKNRYEHLLIAKNLFNLKGYTHVTGADLPQATDIDSKIIEMAKKSNNNFKAATFLFSEIENFGSFWRCPFFLYEGMVLNSDEEGNKRVVYGNQGFKEAQDYILDLDKVDIQKMSNLNPGTKMSDPRTIVKIAKNVLPRLLTSDVLYIPTLAKEGVKTLLAKKQYSDGLRYYYPTRNSGDAIKMLDSIARVFAGVEDGISNVSLGTSGHINFYKDLDSLQDAFRHAKEMWTKEHPGEKISFEELSSFITYTDKKLMDHPEVKKFIPSEKEFFENLRNKERAMSIFTFGEKALKLEQILRAE